MRLLHTADWHMNDRLGRVDRSEDICRSLMHIARYLDEYEVDVMLVAGDLIERGHLDQMQTAVGNIKEIFQPFLQRGGTMIAISGNHDNEVFFAALRDALDLVTPHSHAGSMDTGRLYIAPNPRLLRIPDRDNAMVQFVLMPYPTARCYLRGEQATYSSIEDKHRAIQQSFSRTLDTLTSEPRGFDVRLPSILVSHVHVRGAHVHSPYRMSEADDIMFDPSDIPSHWAYVAYGHIHKAQAAIAGADHIRYAGSIERLDFGERHDEKSVVLFEVNAAGLVDTPTMLPLPSTPMYHIEITDPVAQIPYLTAQYPDAAHALVKYTLHCQPGVHADRNILCREIQNIFPRWYQRDVQELGTGSTSTTMSMPQQMHDVSGTVRAYLQHCLAGHGQRDALLALADELLTEEALQ